MRLLGLGKPKEKQVLSREKAVELGAEMIGEAFLYFLFGGILLFEYYISSRNSEREKEKSRQYQIQLENRIADLELTNATTEAQLRELSRTVGELESQNYSLMQKVFPGGKKR